MRSSCSSLDGAKNEPPHKNLQKSFSGGRKNEKKGEKFPLRRTAETRSIFHFSLCSQHRHRHNYRWCFSPSHKNVWWNICRAFMSFKRFDFRLESFEVDVSRCAGREKRWYWWWWWIYGRGDVPQNSALKALLYILPSEIQNIALNTSSIRWNFFLCFFFLTTNFVLFFPPHLMMTFWLFMRLNPSIRRFSRSSLNATAARYVCERNISMARLCTNTREHNELANKDASLRWWWLVLLSRQRNHFFSSREWKSKENLGFLEVKSRCQSSVEEFSGRADNRWEIFESS